MKGLGLLTHALGICVVSTILASCGANSAMVPQGNRADASAAAPSCYTTTFGLPSTVQTRTARFVQETESRHS